MICPLAHSAVLCTEVVLLSEGPLSCGPEDNDLSMLQGWVNDDLLAKIEKDPVLSDAFKDPTMAQALAQFQIDPQQATKDKPKVSQLTGDSAGTSDKGPSKDVLCQSKSISKIFLDKEVLLKLLHGGIDIA